MDFFKNIFLLLLLLTCLKMHAGINDSATVHKKYRMLYFYDYGTPAYDIDYNSACTVSLGKKYGFANKIKGGCMVRPMQAKRWKNHNSRMERKLMKRFGDDWRKQYARDFAACKKEHS